MQTTHSKITTGISTSSTIELARPNPRNEPGGLGLIEKKPFQEQQQQPIHPASNKIPAAKGTTF